MKIPQVVSRAVASLRIHSLTVVSTLMILFVVLVVYWQDLSILANEAMQNEAMSHIMLVPLLAFFLVYQRGELIKVSLAMERLKGKTDVISFSEITGGALCLSAFLLYWYGSYTFYPLEYHVASLIIFITGVTLILFNVKTLLALIFPTVFLIFLMPPPSNVTYSIGASLGNFSTQASHALLKIVGLPVTLSSQYGPPTLVINTPAGRPIEFAVDLPCSGIYSLVAFTMFATFLVLIVRGSITKKIVLFPLGFLMLSILNILRISLIVLIAYGFGEAVAMTIFHTFSGWILIFIGMLLLLLIAEKLMHLHIFIGTSKTASCPECDNRLKNNEIFCQNCGSFQKNYQIKLPKKFWIKLTALLLASYLVTLSIQAPAFAFAQGLTITNPSPEASTDVFPQVTGYQLKFLYRDQNFEKISHQDASLTYAYISQNISNPTVYVLVGVASSITNLHSWEVCLITWQTARGYSPLVTELESRDIQILKNPPMTARYFVFRHPANYTQVTLYWYQRALFKTGLSIEPRYTRISLIILTRNPNPPHKFEQTLLTLGESIAAYWEPLKTQSIVSLGIPTMQAMLGATILFAIFIQATQYTREWRRKAINFKIFKQLASPKEKLLNQTVKELGQKTEETTTQNIASAFEKATGEAVKLNELIDMLNNLEKHGIINLDIRNILEQPKLVWKT